MAVIVGIDIGGTKMLSGIVSPDGVPHATRRAPTHPDTYLDDLQALASAALADAAARGETVAGIGVGTTGLVDRASGVLRRSLRLGLDDVPIGARLQEAFGLPVQVDNDLHAAALGELTFGCGRLHGDFVLMNAGTGVAAGMVFGHRLHRGVSNVAGEVGHTSVDHDGPACPCGLPGCLESQVVRARNGEAVAPVRFRRTTPPPPAAAYAFLALGIVNLVNLLNPAAVVLAGGMFVHHPAAAAWVAEAVRREALDTAAEALEHIAVAQAGAMLGLIGAAALVLEGQAQAAGSEPPHA